MFGCRAQPGASALLKRTTPPLQQLVMSNLSVGTSGRWHGALAARPCLRCSMIASLLAACAIMTLAGFLNHASTRCAGWPATRRKWLKIGRRSALTHLDRFYCQGEEAGAEGRARRCPQLWSRVSESSPSAECWAPCEAHHRRVHTKIRTCSPHRGLSRAMNPSHSLSLSRLSRATS